MADQWCSNQIKGIRRGREAVGGTPTAAGETPALPNAWGFPPEASQGRLRSTSQIEPNQASSNQIKAIRRGREAVGGTPALPKARGSPAQGQSGSTNQIKVN